MHSKIGRGDGSRTHTSTLGTSFATATTRPELDLWKRRRRSFLTPSLKPDGIREIADRVGTIDDLGHPAVLEDLDLLGIDRDDLGAQWAGDEDALLSSAPEVPGSGLKCLVFRKLHHRAPKTIFKMSSPPTSGGEPRSNAYIVGEKLTLILFLNIWCGQRESHPRVQFGKLACYCNILAAWWSRGALQPPSEDHSLGASTCVSDDSALRLSKLRSLTSRFAGFILHLFLDPEGRNHLTSSNRLLTSPPGYRSH